MARKTTPRKTAGGSSRARREHRARTAARVTGEHPLPEVAPTPPGPTPGAQQEAREVQQQVEKPAAPQREGPRAEAPATSKPAVMLLIDLLSSTWNLARTLAVAPFRLLQAARERPA